MHRIVTVKTEQDFRFGIDTMIATILVNTFRPMKHLTDLTFVFEEKFEI